MAKKSIRLLSNEQRELLSSIPEDISEDEIQYHYTLQPDELAVITIDWDSQCSSVPCTFRDAP